MCECYEKSICIDCSDTMDNEHTSGLCDHCRETKIKYLNEEIEQLK